MSTKTLTTAIEKIAPTAILKIDGPFSDFHAKEVIGLFDDLLAQDFVHFIINFKFRLDIFLWRKAMIISDIS